MCAGSERGCCWSQVSSAGTSRLESGPSPLGRRSRRGGSLRCLPAAELPSRPCCSTSAGLLAWGTSMPMRRSGEPGFIRSDRPASSPRPRSQRFTGVSARLSKPGSPARAPRSTTTASPTAGAAGCRTSSGSTAARASRASGAERRSRRFVQAVAARGTARPASAETSNRAGTAAWTESTLGRVARTYKTEAVVLRSFRLGEADRVLHIYTLDRGRVGAVAKGVRKTKSRFGASLEPLSHAELMLHQGGGELQTVTGVELVRSHREAREQPYRLGVGLVGAEAMLRLFPEQEANDR